jgi:hypothetical protein
MSIQESHSVDLESGGGGRGGPNCYAWAVRYPTRVDPGELSGRKYGTNSDTNLRSAAVRDGLIYHGRTLPPARQGYYIVALVATDDDDSNYHWIRRDSAFEWSHKPGEGTASPNDANGEPITDANPPHSTSFDFSAFFRTQHRGLMLMAQAQGWAINYNRFVGYFYCPNDGLTRQEPGWCVIV